MATNTAPQPSQRVDASTLDVEPRIEELLAEHGFASVNDDGDIVRDNKKVVRRVTDILIQEALASNNDERLEKALSKEALYTRVFGHGPALDDPDELEREAADRLAIYLWSLTSPAHQGRVQRRLAEVQGADDLVLCRRKIDGAPSAYVTRNHDLIVDDFVMPASEKIVRAADKTRKDMSLVTKRQKGLESRVQRELESMAVKTSTALGVTPSAPALGSGRP